MSNYPQAASSVIKKVSENKAVEFKAGESIVRLTPKVVRDYLVSGSKESVTEQEIVMFINLCKYNGLNPWLKEAYCVKFGNEPATLVTAKAAFEKRAENHPQHNGHKAGIIVVTSDGNITYRVGAMILPDETLVGGWAEVFRKDQAESTRIEVSFDEYAGRKKDGSLNSQWAKRPATMIRKVALVQALREAFPQSLGNMYIAEEHGAAEESVSPQIPLSAPEAPEPPQKEQVSLDDL